MSDKIKEKVRNDYNLFHEMSTRWNDNDVYGHINNAIYYQFFDTIINLMLINLKILDFKKGNYIFITPETSCTYFKEIVFPDKITAGLKVKKLGNSSVHYEIGLFKNCDKTTSAIGKFIHVLVDKETHKPKKMSKKIKKSLEKYI